MRQCIFLFIIVQINMAFGADFSITMDDPNSYETPLMTPEERNNAILSQLKSVRTKATLFVCGKRIDSEEGQLLLKKWDNEGHSLSNHSYSHLYYNNPKLTFAEYSSDISKGELPIKDFQNFKKIFRFPFLKSGETKLKRDAIRKFLKNNGYSYGYVTIDASDWYISDRLEKRLRNNPNANIEGYKKYYLDHMWERAQYYDGLAKKVIGRSPKHTILIHHNLLNALFLKDLIDHFTFKGWNLIDTADAFADSLFKAEPQTIPSGESVLWAIAKEKGFSHLRYPAEDGKYEKEAMDKLSL
ncbi:MAG: polysaccharide deacetylase family protein [Halobacteriovoraceae bacterium]|jgi:peptidoglycan-N-acetylglucosamine deacetylase|nr:polysaccharide deacetylase family protein [Halobacteriovoraceae bacterium]